MKTEKTSSHRNGRRSSVRWTAAFDISLQPQNGSSNHPAISGSTLSVNEGGLSCRLNSSIGNHVDKVSIKVYADGQSFRHSGKVIWVNSDENLCGVRFDQIDPAWKEFINPAHTTNRFAAMLDRRELASKSEASETWRHNERRYMELVRELESIEAEIAGPKVKSFLRSKSTTFTPDIIRERREWLSQLTKTQLHHIAQFSEDADEFKGKIESPVGVAHVPLGVAGPLRIKGEHAKGTFFIPLATTEGALVTSYTLGSHIITRSGGADVRILKDELRVAPMFVFQSLPQAKTFCRWIDVNFKQVKEVAESTSRHLTLKQLSTIVNGRRVIVNFHYNTGDAMGMNMACNATEVACRKIKSIVRPEEFWLRSNFNANKKATAHNFVNGYGKTVTADVTIPRKLIALLDTTPEEMQQYFFRTMLADIHAGMIGANGHFANAITAIFIACGQDVASVANSHVGISTCEVTKSGDLYFSAYLSNILVGTVGGGTSFGTARECLQMMGCLGSNKSMKFAEIVAATALAGEIAICASIVNGTYVLAHETFGRNRPSS